MSIQGKVRNTKLIGLLLCLIVSLSTIPTIVDSWGTFNVYISAPTSAKVYDSIHQNTYTLTASCSKTADWIGIFVDGVCVKSGTNRRSITYYGYKFTYIKKMNIRASAEIDGRLKMTTKTCRTRFNMDDPDSSRNNLGTDQMRTPGSLTVYDTQHELVYLSSSYPTYHKYTTTPQKWMEVMWDVLKDYQLAVWCGMPDWFGDVYMAEDFLQDGEFDNKDIYDGDPGRNWKIGYDCSNWAVFISGIARSVGLPARMWSIMGGGELADYDHMIPEVYTGDTSPLMDNNGWWMLDVGHDAYTSSPTNPTMRCNWESTLEHLCDSWNVDIDDNGTPYTSDDTYHLYRAALIWNIYNSLPEPYGYSYSDQEKAWESTDKWHPCADQDYPQDNLYIYIPTAISEFYGIESDNSYDSLFHW